MDLAQLAVPQDMNLWFFLLKHSQLLQHLMWITVIRKDDLIVENRFQYREF